MRMPVRGEDLEGQVPPQCPTPEWGKAHGNESQSDSGTSQSSGPDKADRRGLLTPAQWIYACLALVVELCLIWLAGSSQRLTSAPAHNTCIYGIAHLMLISLYPRGGEASQAPPGRSTAAAPGSEAKAPRTRSYYLDNVKIFVTEMVFIHHISGAFGADADMEWAFEIGAYKNMFADLVGVYVLGPNQSYFMCLLFFTSGIFTPSSLERKGASEFMRDKLKRLGWPLVITYFVVFVLMRGVWGGLLVGGSFQSYAYFGESVTWFLATLIMLNLAYTVVPLPQQTLPRPTILQVMLLCCMLGAIQGWIQYNAYDAAFLNVSPKIQGALPFDVAFFVAGCFAKRSGWLEAIEKLSPSEYWSARVVAIILIVGLPGVGLALDADDARQTLWCNLVFGSILGIETAALSVSVLHFFAVHCNFQNKLLECASRGQYAAYVYQTVIIPAATWTYVKLLEATGYPLEFYFDRDIDTFVSSTELPLSVLVAGWLYTIVVVTAVSWPLAYYSRKLPLLREVL